MAISIKKNSPKAESIHNDIVTELENAGSEEARMMAEVISGSDGYDLEMIDSIASQFQGWAAFVRGRSGQPARLAPSRVPHIASPLPGKFSESRAIYLFPPV